MYLSKNNKKGMFFNKHTKSILKNETAGSIILIKEWQLFPLHPYEAVRSIPQWNQISIQAGYGG